jgi:hypothetical protein
LHDAPVLAYNLLYCHGMPQVQQLYNDLYVHLINELKTAMTGLTVSQQQQQQGQSPGQPEPTCSSSCSSTGVQDSGEKLLQLAAECEAAGDITRSHALHQRRLLLLQDAEVRGFGAGRAALTDMCIHMFSYGMHLFASPLECLHCSQCLNSGQPVSSPCMQAWYQYGTFCMRVKEHTRAQPAFREALSISQEHGPAAAALACLGLALSQSKDVEGGADPAALEWAEVLGHSSKDAAAAGASNGPSAAGVLPWALLALLYRVQGEAQSLVCPIAAWQACWHGMVLPQWFTAAHTPQTTSKSMPSIEAQSG